MSVVIESPRSRKRGSFNFEKYAWMYMRISGVVLIVLIFGHLFANLMVGEGIHAINFAFVAGKWASPFWQVWDSLMLVLALVHGTNGMRTLVNDYTEREWIRKTLIWTLWSVCIALIVIGLLALTTFTPCGDAASMNILKADLIANNNSAAFAALCPAK
jgi:succinate dehydrogenase / fumarate reductase membrane anchor subunit